MDEKVKIGRISDVPAEVEIKTIEEYLFNVKSMLFLFWMMNKCCVNLNKNLVCCHCKRLRYALNTDAIICLKKEDLPKEFKLVDINKYLEHLKADLIFYYSKEENEMKLSIDSLDWGDFFVDKETMWKKFFI